MTTWRRGRAIVARILQRGRRRTDDVVAEALAGGATRVPGTAIYMFKDPGCAPPAMVSNLRHNHVLHETTIVLSIVTADVPRVEPATAIVDHRPRWRRLRGRPDVRVHGHPRRDRRVAAATARRRGGIDLDDVTFFLGRETVASIPKGEMPRWREHLFVVLNRGAASAARFYQLPSPAGVRGRHPGRDLTDPPAHPCGNMCSCATKPRSCTPTSTRSTRRSSSATTRRCADAR